jgi:hypothetical protein
LEQTDFLCGPRQRFRDREAVGSGYIQNHSGFWKFLGIQTQKCRTRSGS